MEEIGITLSLEEFMDAANRLYKTVSLPDKNTLVRKTKALSYIQEEPCF